MAVVKGLQQRHTGRAKIALLQRPPGINNTPRHTRWSLCFLSSEVKISFMDKNKKSLRKQTLIDLSSFSECGETQASHRPLAGQRGALLHGPGQPLRRPQFPQPQSLGHHSGKDDFTIWTEQAKSIKFGVFRPYNKVILAFRRWRGKASWSRSLRTARSRRPCSFRQIR